MKPCRLASRLHLRFPGSKSLLTTDQRRTLREESPTRGDRMPAPGAPVDVRFDVRDHHELPGLDHLAPTGA
ncbi:MAG TPA: hypothetical protein VM818_07375 [Vicinamibacterales bacterium]|nr:hypothetical protein [Vicinamibacterales bacterium]